MKENKKKKMVTAVAFFFFFLVFNLLRTQAKDKSNFIVH